MIPFDIRVWTTDWDVLNRMMYKDELELIYNEHGLRPLNDLDTKLVYMFSFRLLDKTGKKIYTGDILIDDEYEDDKMMWVVNWGKDEGAFIMDGINAPNMICEWVSRANDRTDYTVIGNIFENPDLLGDKKDEMLSMWADSPR